jgi:putative ABC transport system substrate-binding protein
MKKRLIGLSVGLMLPWLAPDLEVKAAKKIARIGYLTTATSAADVGDRDAFRAGLRSLGYVEGRNITIFYRYAEGGIQQLPQLARDLVALELDVIFVAGTRAAVALKTATGRIPIVMISSDPLGSGLIDSFARPGGNVTGLSLMFQELAGKRLALFREAFPKIRRIGALWNALSDARFRETERAAARLGFEVLPMEINGATDLDAAFAEVVNKRAGGLFTFTSAVLSANRKRIVDLAAAYRIPGIYHNHGFVEDGGLMSYSPSLRGSFRRAATYVDKILKGASPAELPVDQPMKFELLINLRAARQIGITVPPQVLARADQIIN